MTMTMTIDENEKKCNYTTAKEMGWSIARRERDPRFNPDSPLYDEEAEAQSYARQRPYNPDPEKYGVWFRVTFEDVAHRQREAQEREAAQESE